MNKYLIDSGFSEEDLPQLADQGISQKILEDQLRFINRTSPGLKINRPASANDGVVQLQLSDLDHFEQSYNSNIEGLQLYKFVPASGAASRMFKDLIAYLSDLRIPDVQVEPIIQNLEKFAFYQTLGDRLKLAGHELDLLIERKKYRTILRFLLTEAGLNYQNLPKALLEFHKYQEGSRTAFEEHLIEGFLYANSNELVKLHFTVSEKYQKAFQQLLDQVQPSYQEKLNVTYQVSFSVQRKKTDTIAVDAHNHIFRKENGQLLFRPGGHGSLLMNLNEIEADLIFIKNIDNVAPDYLKPPMVRYKKAITGIILKAQKRIFGYLRKLSATAESNLSLEEEIRSYLSALGFILGEHYQEYDDSKKFKTLFDILNRPLRVCSVIRTSKTTGGGPYWFSSANGDLTLQILENAQLTGDNINTQSSYAHITDLVCAVRNYQGKKFDLEKFTDPETAFVTNKSYLGQKIKALEHPGLWNGSMAHWNTILIEIPENIFHPVKSILDLLHNDHQPG